MWKTTSSSRASIYLFCVTKKSLPDDMPRLISLKGLASPECLPCGASDRYAALKREIHREAARLAREGVLTNKKHRLRSRGRRWFPLARFEEDERPAEDEEEYPDLSIETLGTRDMHRLLRNFERYRIDFFWRFDEQKKGAEVRSIFAPVPMEWGLVRKILVDALNLNQKNEHLEATEEGTREPLAEDRCVRPGKDRLILHRRPGPAPTKTPDYSTGLAYASFLETGDQASWASYLKASEELARSEERYERDAMIASDDSNRRLLSFEANHRHRRPPCREDDGGGKDRGIPRGRKPAA